MKVRIPSKPRIAILLLLLGTAVTGLSALFFNRLDQVVNGDLYGYGLQFSPEWAIQYWNYSRMLTTCLSVAMTVTSISFLAVLLQFRTGKMETVKFVSSLLLLVGIGSVGLSAFFFNQLDYVVNHDLYRYGLQFSYQWADVYWTYARSFLGLLGFVIFTNGFSLALLFGGRKRQTEYVTGAHAPTRLDSARLIPPIVFFAGVIALALSVGFTSSILAFIGLGLVLWGALLSYIRPEKYVKQILLDKTVIPSLVILDEIITELGYRGKGVHLPPEYFTDFELAKVYISAEENAKLPLPEEIQKQENRVFLNKHAGMLVTSPGFELAKLFEKTMKTNFTKVDLQYLEQNLPKLLTELEIAQGVEMHSAEKMVSVKIQKSMIKDLCNETGKLTNICGSVGCPLCSAIASSIAKATGKPVIIQSDLTSENGQIIDIRYRLLDRIEETRPREPESPNVSSRY